jgi:hypothetical protein
MPPEEGDVMELKRPRPAGRSVVFPEENGHREKDSHRSSRQAKSRAVKSENYQLYRATVHMGVLLPIAVFFPVFDYL